MKHTQSAGGILVNTDGKILIVTNGIGSVTLPKGSMERGEEPIETAEREILEESGLGKIEVLSKLGIIVREGFSADNAVTPSVIKHIHVYLCRTDETYLDPQVGDIISAEWVAPSEALKRLSRPAEVAFVGEHMHEIEQLIAQ